MGPEERPCEVNQTFGFILTPREDRIFAGGLPFFRPAWLGGDAHRLHRLSRAVATKGHGPEVQGGSLRWAIYIRFQ